MMRSALKGSMSLSFNTASSSSLFPNWKPSEIRFSNRWGQRKVERSLSHSPDLLDLQCCRKRRDLPPLWEVVGGLAVVWWDLNTCPVPAGVDPRCVRPCIESAVEKEIGFRTAVTIYAMGNLESISIDLLQKIFPLESFLLTPPAVFTTYLNFWSTGVNAHILHMS
ncbi:NYN domain-containing protein [Raphanus sativus]|nr:NYN domain-containing protein [Raphanus sativus]